jgi:hypothetical protein
MAIIDWPKVLGVKGLKSALCPTGNKLILPLITLKTGQYNERPKGSKGLD